MGEDLINQRILPELAEALGGDMPVAFAQNGVSASSLAKLFVPIGMELNAETPEEIAVSIMSEIVMELRRVRRCNGRPDLVTAG
jgi:hypothetical protein